MDRGFDDGPDRSVRSRSLAAQLTWVSILMVTLVLLTVGTGLIYIANKTQRDSSFRMQQQSAEQVSRLISGYVNRALGRLEFFLTNETLTTLSPLDQKKALENLLLSSLPLYSAVSLLDKDGNERSKVSRFHTFLPGELKNKVYDPVFISAIQGFTYMGSVAFFDESGLLSMRVALPLRTTGAAIAGVLVADINISHLWREVARIEVGRGGYAYLVDLEGRFIAYQKLSEVLQRYGEDVSTLPPVSEFMHGGRNEPGQVKEYQGLFNEQVIGVHAPIQGTNWAVVVEQPVSEAFSGITKMETYLFGLVIISVLLAGCLSFIISRRLIDPIRRLTSAAKRLGAGDLEAEVIDVTRQDEVGVLSHAFNKMQKDLQSLYAGLKRKVQELEETQQALGKSEEKYRLLIENQSDLVVKFDLERRFLFASPSYCDLFGKTEQELIGRKFGVLFPDDVRKTSPLDMEKLVRPPYSMYIEKSTMTQFGLRWLGWNIVGMRDGENNLIAVISVGRDITDRITAETALRESEERFRTLVEESPLGISLIGKDGLYKYINPQFIDMFGYSIEDIPTGRDWFHKAYPDETYRRRVIETWQEDQKIIGRGRARPRTYSVTCKDGSQKEIHFRPVTMQNLNQFVIYEDITEREKIERQLQQARKFEAIGTLAGGIAHDFNNLLMGIQGRTSLMMMDLNPSHPLSEHIQAIEEYIRSATDLTKQILGFARGGKYEVKPIDINELVSESSAMFGRTRKQIQIQTAIHGSPLVIEVDRRQIEQVLLNIYINAWQAMPEGGTLYLETRMVVLDDKQSNVHQVEEGKYALASITDTGVGMDEATRQRIFDPFFTTKEKSRGTGLGLASAYGIIKNHGGVITVYSEIGHGSTFNIYIPLSDKAVHRDVPVKQGLIKGSELILLVDDENMILDVAKSMLEVLGYHVLVSRDGREAVNLVASRGEEIDLVILDMIMPDMDGGKTFDRIREIHPTLPVLLSSGYTMNGMATKIMRRGCNGFIQKPFNISDLSKKVRQVLDKIASPDENMPE